MSYSGDKLMPVLKLKENIGNSRQRNAPALSYVWMESSLKFIGLF
jgi:hypothetical protein